MVKSNRCKLSILFGILVIVGGSYGDLDGILCRFFMILNSVVVIIFYFVGGLRWC